MNPASPRPCESDEAYAAFVIYSGMGEDRSLKRVAEGLGCPLRRIERFSSRFEWKKRLGKMPTATPPAESTPSDAASMRAEHLAYSREALQLARATIRKLSDDLAKGFDISTTAVASLARDAARLERLTVQEKAEHAADESTADYSRLGDVAFDAFRIMQDIACGTPPASGSREAKLLAYIERFQEWPLK